jgi:LysM repeat protein
LTHIARRYSVSVDDLRAANPRVRPRLMQIGQRIIVPKAPSVRAGLGGGGGAVRVERQLFLYTVRPGDTLSGIAYRHGVGLGELLEWNGLSRSSVIRPGDEVRIYRSGRD